MNFIFLDSVDSTQNIARKELINCDFESSSILNPLVCAIIANNQSAGRGRLGRKWVSESGQSFLASYGAILPKKRCYGFQIQRMAAYDCRALRKRRVDWCA